MTDAKKEILKKIIKETRRGEKLSEMLLTRTLADLDKLDLSVEEIENLLRKCGIEWRITKHDVGRELFVVPMGSEAFKIIAQALIDAMKKKTLEERVRILEEKVAINEQRIRRARRRLGTTYMQLQPTSTR